MARKDLQGRLQRRAKKAGVSLTPDLSLRIGQYLELLHRWNTVINLTALGDPDEAIDRLVLEPLVAARHVPADAAALLDVGSGGGSPAIPLKLALPGLSLWMVEPKTRKAAFLREAVRHIGLADAHVETSRSEELLTRPDMHEAMHVVTIRAVRADARMLTTLQAFLRPGGVLFLFRGPSGPEAPALVVPPLQWQATYPLIDSLQSRLVVMSKVPHGR